jgi:hypothetical protein
VQSLSQLMISTSFPGAADRCGEPVVGEVGLPHVWFGIAAWNRM